MPLQIFELPKGFQQSMFKGKMREGSLRVRDYLEITITARLAAS